MLVVTESIHEGRTQGVHFFGVATNHDYYGPAGYHFLPLFYLITVTICNSGASYN